MTQVTKADLTTEIATQFPSTGAGAITASTTRGFLGDLVDSVAFLLDSNVFAPTAGANKCFSITQTGSGSPSQDSGLDIGWNFNSIFIRDDGVDASGFAAGSQTVNGLSIGVESHGAKGIGQAIFGTIWVKEAPGQASNALNQFVAGQFIGQASDNMGGTPGSEIGGIFGIGATALATSGATDLLNVSNELNLAVQAGASTSRKSVLSLAAHNTDAVSGSDYDTVISLSAENGAIKSDNGILFSNYNGAHPCKTTGTLIATQGAATVGSVIDCSSYAVTDYLINGPIGSDFYVTGDGAVGLNILPDSAITLSVLIQSGHNVAARFRSRINGAGVEPLVQTYKESSVPVAGDGIGSFQHLGTNSVGDVIIYAGFEGRIVDPTATSEDSSAAIKIYVAGAVSTAAKFSNSGLNLANIPTADPVVLGQVWNSSGTLKISAG